MRLATIAMRNVVRDKFRTTLTLLGTAISVLAFVLLQTISTGYTRGANFAVKERIVTRNRVSFQLMMPHRYLDDVRLIPNVKAATSMSWFDAHDNKHDNEFFSSWMVEQDAFFDVFDRLTLPEEHKKAWIADRQGILVGESLAQKFGWKVGDILPLKSGMYDADAADNPWQFTVDGVYSSTAAADSKTAVYVHYDYINSTLPPNRQNQIQTISSRVGSSSQIVGVTQAIDRGFEDRDVQTTSLDERAYQAGMLGGAAAILKGLSVISVVIMFITMLILGNTVAMGVRERTTEYGVLRALGFLPRHVLTFILGEAALTGLVGGLIGLALAYPLITYGVAPAVQTNMSLFFPALNVPASVMLSALFLSTLLGFLAGLVPGLRASRLKTTDALRRVA
jgi:putative ABC transport system permease protein